MHDARARLPGDDRTVLAAHDLLAGAAAVHAVEIPARVLRPAPDGAPQENGTAGTVRLRPLSVGVLSLISRAARDDAGLVPLLMIKESLVEPALGLEQIRELHVGLVHFLIAQVNRISGLAPDGEALDEHGAAPMTQAHVLLARHFGWTPDQVAQLTPAQVAVYLKGLETLAAWDSAREEPG
ncbi:MAG TPA: hypothetical protein VE826_13090 [Dongiaceae bacterium]|nr:hypothetical protein [Dongiaceae bacterium]